MHDFSLSSSLLGGAIPLQNPAGSPDRVHDLWAPPPLHLPSHTHHELNNFKIGKGHVFHLPDRVELLPKLSIVLGKDLVSPRDCVFVVSLPFDIIHCQSDRLGNGNVYERSAEMMWSLSQVIAPLFCAQLHISVNSELVTVQHNINFSVVYNWSLCANRNTADLIYTLHVIAVFNESCKWLLHQYLILTCVADTIGSE